ncbi:hypothetical protein V3F56_11025 [Moorellaceae bacterium AZ2]
METCLSEAEKIRLQAVLSQDIEMGITEAAKIPVRARYAARPVRLKPRALRAVPSVKSAWLWRIPSFASRPA